MTVVSVHPPSGGFVGIAALVTLGIYWLAHLYTEVLAERISEPGISVWHRTSRPPDTRPRSWRAAFRLSRATQSCTCSG